MIQNVSSILSDLFQSENQTNQDESPKEYKAINEFSFDPPSDSTSNEEKSDSEPEEFTKKQEHKLFVILFITMFIARTDQGLMPALNTTLGNAFGYSTV